jgi:hypothetical protein
MLFDIKQFEQFFKEATLKKGLRLFEKGEVEPVEPTFNSEFLFYVKEFELRVKKRGDKISQFACSCEKGEYCAHLSAALFYLQQDALGVRMKKRAVRAQTSMRNRAGKTEHRSELQKAENENLIQFIKEHNSRILPAEILTFLSDKTTVTLFNVFCLQFELLVEPFLELKKLDQKGIDKMTRELSVFIKRVELKMAGEENLFFLYLALLVTCISVFRIRFTGNESGILKLYEVATEKLENYYHDGLSGRQLRSWYQACLMSIKTNANLQCDAFLFLIPRAVNATKNKEDLEELHNLLNKRRYKINYAQRFDKLLIARLQVAIRKWDLFKTAFPLNHIDNELELIIARTELFFCSDQDDKAFHILEANYEKVKNEQKNYYGDYLEYIISKAKDKKNAEIESKYLREGFINNLFILPQKLDRFLELIPKEGRSQEIDTIIKRLKSNVRGYSFEKVSALLLKDNRWNDLLEELKRQHNKFGLVHAIALKKLPEYDSRLIELYFRHLSEDLIEKSSYPYQQELVRAAKKYLRFLPENIVDEMVKKLLDKVGKPGPLYRFINEEFDFPFLKEDGVTLPT